ncbi:hypothetical protein AVEN_200872-1 [Araneus ventricosus]|uniref:Uncharacterized protein n=1 Tax=Araneus ventricosus TaxID=182803 RepID=A0A4Y2TIU9_ARAVE|nr:hypothetical protein AVEN_200872-1 [Araneus ventricosus]
MKSVVRRPDLRSQRPKSIFSPPRKSSPCSSLSSSGKIPSSPSSLSLLTPIVLLLGERSTGLSTNPRQFCRWSPPQRAIIGSLPFLGRSFCRKRFLRREINYPFHRLH